MRRIAYIILWLASSVRSEELSTCVGINQSMTQLLPQLFLLSQLGGILQQSVEDIPFLLIVSIHIQPINLPSVDSWLKCYSAPKSELIIKVNKVCCGVEN
jgi:hypothetical protein